MEIDVYSVLGSDGRLNNTEKTHQKQLHLCLYCGHPGHQAKNCISKRGSLARKICTQVATLSTSWPMSDTNSVANNSTNSVSPSNIKSVAGKALPQV